MWDIDGPEKKKKKDSEEIYSPNEMTDKILNKLFIDGRKDDQVNRVE